MSHPRYSRVPVFLHNCTGIDIDPEWQSHFETKTSLSKWQRTISTKKLCSCYEERKHILCNCPPEVVYFTLMLLYFILMQASGLHLEWSQKWPYFNFNQIFSNPYLTYSIKRWMFSINKPKCRDIMDDINDMNK